MKLWFNALLAANGGLSMMRLMSLMCITTACVLGLIAIIRNSNFEGATLLISPFLASGFAGKVMQKKDEAAKKNET